METKRLGRRIGIFVLVGFVAFAVICIFLPSNRGPRAASNRIKCASNLRQIGLAIKINASESGGIYPPDLATVLTTEDITSDVFVCPDDAAATRANGPTTAAFAEQMGDLALHHCSYLYAGVGLNDKTIGSDDVLAFEPPSDHNGDGINVLFGDGHVDWFSTRPGQSSSIDYDRLLANFHAGERPLELAPEK